jgi:hypothetical protein
MTPATAASRVDNIRHSLVGLKMPRALEMLDAKLRRYSNAKAASPADNCPTLPPFDTAKNRCLWMGTRAVSDRVDSAK